MRKRNHTVTIRMNKEEYESASKQSERNPEEHSRKL